MTSLATTVSTKEIAQCLGITARAVNKKASREAWMSEAANKRGDRMFALQHLPAEIQKRLVDSSATVNADLIPTLSPGAALSASLKLAQVDNMRLAADPGYRPAASWTDETALSPAVLRDPRVKRIAGIVQEAQEIPRGWKKRRWVEAVAVKHGTSWQTIYKWIKKYEKKGLAGLQHTKGNGGRAKVWSDDALEWWVGLCLKREHRKIAKDALYGLLTVEAQRREGWRIGSYESALWWFNKRVTPQLLALQRGGLRALDNTLPPVLRDYSDLLPFEILVGDQHRFDFWVVDDDSGEVFRPEGYFWQDLRTRNFYGGAVDRKYDAYLIGLALRMGMNIFGAFGSIYTDNGRPELSRYIMGIMSDMRTLGLSATQTMDVPADIDVKDPEAVNPCVILPGSHRKAIVRNAKAKMIEGTFNSFEGILRDHFRQPGYVKRLNDPSEHQDIDQKEAQRLADKGRLPTFMEFVVTMYRAMDFFNREKPHRGVLKEWAWRPRPRKVTPMECLQHCYADGWRPRRLSSEAVDLVFLARVARGRVVDRGRISFCNHFFEHDSLVDLHKQRVDVRYDPMDPDWLLVFNGDRFVCRAEPVEYSSMKDQDLAGRKIEEKRRLRKSSLTEYRRLTSTIPDFLAYSQTPAIEQAAARLRQADKTRQAEQVDLYRERSESELAAEVAALEQLEHDSHRPQPNTKSLPERPSFGTEYDRYAWIIKFEAAGGQLSTQDLNFKTEYEGKMDEGLREHFDMMREYMEVAL